MVTCKDQAEIDYYWGKLSAVPESEQCGWLKDKYGLSWQINSTPIQTLLKVSAVPPHRSNQHPQNIFSSSFL
ncbi:VOC family protein [Agriterribacter humi]|uniref:VOC family protein n=1 Tax=Agriterribacter humi TaxID=1104781 RepID=UPI0012648BF3|nr:VOC family protein [Agriterribacter humi]